jgi:fumarate reductase (CoM/CoB) subunit A
LDAGCELVDMEMVQIHPTGIAYPEKRKGRLITEKVRGHFGTLKNKHGERFMSKYYPEKMELAGRDEVARSIYQEVKEGRGTEHGGVYLDITHWEKGKAEKTIPEVFEGFMRDGIDIRKEMMEISPSMHHMMGGININEWGETCVKNMYAVGEVTRNIHGANRLGGNSLAEGQVFGRRAGIRAAENVKKEKLHEIPVEMVTEEIKRLKSFERDEGLSAQDLALQLKTVMWEKVGLIRDEEGLQEALTVVKHLQRDTIDIAVHDHVELQEALELEEMLKVAETVIVAALLRKESRGAHYRTDYPTMEKDWEKNIIVYKDKNGDLQTKTVPVVK